MAQQKYIDALNKVNGEFTTKEFAEAAGISPKTASKKLKELADEGYVVNVKRGVWKVVDNVAQEDEENVTEEVAGVEESVNETANTDENDEDDDLVDIYINGRYLVSAPVDEADAVAKRCNPTAEFDKEEGNKRYYTVKSGEKG